MRRDKDALLAMLQCYAPILCASTAAHIPFAGGVGHHACMLDFANFQAVPVLAKHDYVIFPV